MEEEEQGGSMHENNIMGEVVSRTLQYTQMIRLFEEKYHFYTWRKESEKHDCCFFYFHMRMKIVSTWEREIIVSSYVVLPHGIKDCFPQWQKDGLFFLLLRLYLPHDAT
jgi:hypothetical protein